MQESKWVFNSDRTSCIAYAGPYELLVTKEVRETLTGARREGWLAQATRLNAGESVVSWIFLDPWPEVIGAEGPAFMWERLVPDVATACQAAELWVKVDQGQTMRTMLSGGSIQSPDTNLFKSLLGHIARWKGGLAQLEDAQRKRRNAWKAHETMRLKKGLGRGLVALPTPAKEGKEDF